MSLPKTSLEQWAVLAAIVDYGGFAQAAEALHRSQSAISYAVARLQESIGLPLLEIEGRKAILTPHGENLLQRARSILSELRTLECVAGSLKSGWEADLRLVVDTAFPREQLLKIVADLRAMSPYTQLQLFDAVLSGAEEAITNHRADVVVTSRVPAGFFGDWLVDINFIAVAHAEHPLFQIEHPLTEKELARHTQAMVRDSGVISPRDDGWIRSNLRCTVSSMEAALATVQAKLAYAWLPESLIKESLLSGDLRMLPLAAGASRHVPLYLVLVRSELAGPAARSAAECFKLHA